MFQFHRTISTRLVLKILPSFSSCSPLRLFTKFPQSRSFSGGGGGSSANESDSLKRRSCKFEAVHLKSRSLIKLQGADTLALLQGLITNDVAHFKDRPAIYALFLNNQGRVLWDTLLYHFSGQGEHLTFVECDSSIKNNLITHLKLFRLRKKVEIVDAGEGDEALDVWVVFDHGHTALSKALETEECCGPVLPQTSKRADFPVTVDPSLLSFGDPRLNELGWRIFVPKNNSSLFPPKDIAISTESSYTKLRYALGVAEGARELPSAACFPLESNGDYLHGVSFHKGCYLGQELTARTHHTGVVRKRIMPFTIPENSKLENTEDLSSLQLVSSPGGKSLGKIRGICGSYGIGLIRIEQALSATEASIEDVKVSVEKPFWWPKEISKEKKTRQ